MGRKIFIGDVHGCVEEARALIQACEFTAGEDEIVFVGDLVAKGPDSQGVLQLAREIKARGVRGNHDHHVLVWRRKGAEAPPLKPHHKQVADTLTEADWRYLEGLPLVLRLPELHVLVVHAGFVPGVAISQQKAEHLLNLRSITSDGRPSKKIHDGQPWASTWNGPDHVIFGHDAMRGLQEHRFATGLDSGCVYGRELTAFILPERRFVRVPAKRAYATAKGSKG